MAPTILFVPGFWEGPTVFEPVAALLQNAETSDRDETFPTEIASLPSTGKCSPGNPTMKDDIAAVRAHLNSLIEEAGRKVLLVLHSAGGFIGSEAMEGMAVTDRRQKGLSGGVVGIVFLAAGAFPEGHQHGPLPFFDVKGGSMYCADTRHTLLSDLDDADAEKWMSRLECQPADGWDGTTTYCGWRDVPCTYMICEGDQLIPPGLQEQLAQLAGAEIERCSAGHVCMLTAKEKVVDVVRKAIKRSANA